MYIMVVYHVYQGRISYCISWLFIILYIMFIMCMYSHYCGQNYLNNLFKLGKDHPFCKRFG